MNCEEIKKVENGEDAIFCKYREAFPEQADYIVSDGLASVEHYMQAPVKIVFLLKETNDAGGGGWDLREFMYKGARWQTWNPITRWIEGLFDLFQTGKVRPWEHYQDVTLEKRLKFLKYVGAVNLKKIPGSATANGKEIQEYVNDNKELLKKQLDLYKPDIVICCGKLENSDVLQQYRNIYGIDNTSYPVECVNVSVHSKQSYGYFFDKNRTIIIDSYHPGYLIKHQVLFEELLDAISQIKNKYSI